MVTVVEGLRRLTVDQKIEGSRPSSHPTENADTNPSAFLFEFKAASEIGTAPLRQRAPRG